MTGSKRGHEAGVEALTTPDFHPNDVGNRHIVTGRSPAQPLMGAWVRRKCGCCCFGCWGTVPRTGRSPRSVEWGEPCRAWGEALSLARRKPLVPGLLGHHACRGERSSRQSRAGVWGGNRWVGDCTRKPVNGRNQWPVGGDFVGSPNPLFNIENVS